MVEAIILVFLVMYLFLQNFRPQSSRRLPYRWLFSGRLRSCGGRFHHQHVNYVRDGAGDRVLVDDAIVVVENVERVIAEDSYRRRKQRINRWGRSNVRWSDCRCSFRSVYADGLYERSNREIYRQFSITLISSMLLSVFWQ